MSTIIDNKYKIIHHKHYDEYGEINKEYYTIKKIKTFLFFDVWKSIEMGKYSYGGYYKEPIKFNTKKDALNFINDILSTNKPYDKWVEE